MRNVGLTLLLLASSQCATSVGPKAPRSADSPIVRPGDLDGLRGEWLGTLTYTDYTTGRQTTISARAESRGSKLQFSYPDEPGHEHDDDFSIGAGGRTLGGLSVVGRSVATDGTLTIELEERGTDGNDHKPTSFRHVIRIGPATLSLTKLAKPDGAGEYFERSSYNLRRVRS